MGGDWVMGLPPLEGIDILRGEYHISHEGRLLEGKATPSCHFHFYFTALEDSLIWTF